MSNLSSCQHFAVEVIIEKAPTVNKCGFRVTTSRGPMGRNTPIALRFVRNQKSQPTTRPFRQLRCRDRIAGLNRMQHVLCAGRLYIFIKTRQVVGYISTKWALPGPNIRVLFPCSLHSPYLSCGARGRHLSSGSPHPDGPKLQVLNLSLVTGRRRV